MVSCFTQNFLNNSFRFLYFFSRISLNFTLKFCKVCVKLFLNLKGSPYFLIIKLKVPNVNSKFSQDLLIFPSLPQNIPKAYLLKIFLTIIN